MRLARDFRLIPIVLLATICLFALKVSGLVFDGGYTLAERLQGRNKTDMQITTAESVPDYPKIIVADKQAVPVAPAARQTSTQSWAKEMFSFNDPNRDVTGSIGNEDAAKGEPLKVSEKAPNPPKLEIAGNSYPLEYGKISSPGERAVLERLQERRTELDTRSREIEMRESLLKAAEKRLEAKVVELKDAEARVNTAMGARDKAEADRFKSIVSMYENMKGKDAARIFDRLELKILVDVATQMNPRKMSEILALMTPESAERLTVELASRASSPSKSHNADHLPKIEGKSN
ncbi:MAG: flagellar protein FlbB [Rhizobiales bacterium]|nr:flagellar protein FlbB [Hyphomicrobiales bacterium]